MQTQRRSRIVWPVAALAVSGACLVAMLLGTGGRLSLPLDDAFIFFQYAREFVAGHPFRYNGTDPASGGVTSVLTLIIDAIGYLVGFRGDGMIVFSLLIGAAGFLVMLLAAERLGRALGMRHPWWPPVFLILCGPLVWGFNAGMDLPVFVGPLLMAVAAWADEAARGPSRLQTILWGSIAAASRPEGIIFGILLAAMLLVERKSPMAAPDDSPADTERAAGPAKQKAQSELPPAARGFSPGALIPVAAGLAPVLVLLAFTGRLSPTSMKVKGVLGLPGVDLGTWIGGALEYFASVVREIFFGTEGERPARLMANNGSGVLFYLAPLTLPLFLAGVIPVAARESSRRRSGPALFTMLALLAGLASASLVVPKTWHWHRYLMPWYALVLPFAAFGLERLLGFLETASPPASRPSRDAIDRLGLAVYGVLAAPGLLYFLLAFAQNSADICYQQKSLAAWSRVNVPAGVLIGVNDAGALRYDGNHPIMDLEGLVTTSLTEPRRHGSSSLFEALERLPANQRPAWLIVYPNWYDAAFLKPHRLLFQRKILRQTIAGGNPMNVYQADWSLAGSGDLPSSPEVIGALAGRRLVDRLDVADLADESRHQYRFRSLDGQYQGILEMQPVDEGGASLIDGGRLISRDERFRVEGASPGRDMVLAARSRSGFRVHVKVDGSPAGEWIEPGRSGANWTESTFTIAGSSVRTPSPEITIEVAEPHQTAYTAFHYWIYQ